MSDPQSYEARALELSKRATEAAEKWPEQAQQIQADASKAADSRHDAAMQQARELHDQAEQAAAQRHQDMLAAYAAAQMPADWELAVHVLAGIPPGLAEDEEARVLQRRIAQIKRLASGALPAPAPAPQPAPPPPLPTYKDINELCQHVGFGGFLARAGCPPGYLQRLQATGASSVRCWYTADWDGVDYRIDPAQYATMVQAVAEAHALGLTVVVVVSVSNRDMPFGHVDRTAAYPALVSEVHQTHLLQPEVVIDLCNEPTPPDTTSPWSAEQHAELGAQWRALASECIARLPAWRRVVYQLGLGGDPSNFANLLPLDAPQVIHGAMMYHPHNFTHQGVPELQAGQPLPPMQPLSDTDRAIQQASLDRMGEWSELHRRPVMIVETSAIRYAPGCVEYVERVLRYAVARHWPAFVHEFEGWPGWWPSDEMMTMLRQVFAAQSGPPMVLPDEQAAWYLDSLTPELQQYGWDVSIESAKRHWREWGRQQGRKWAPWAPGWGPAMKDRP